MSLFFRGTRNCCCCNEILIWCSGYDKALVEPQSQIRSFCENCLFLCFEKLIPEHSGTFWICETSSYIPSSFNYKKTKSKAHLKLITNYHEFESKCVDIMKNPNRHRFLCGYFKSSIPHDRYELCDVWKTERDTNNDLYVCRIDDFKKLLIKAITSIEFWKPTESFYSLLIEAKQKKLDQLQTLMNQLNEQITSISALQKSFSSSQ